MASHLVVALIALVVIGGATRVMEAGLACPDWPLCFGSFLPGRQMNVQVFLEWFHRLDAFLIGIALLVQFAVSIVFKTRLPKWLVWTYGILLLIVAMQGALGALTVLQLLPSVIVTAHLALALALVALMSGLSQLLLETNRTIAPTWWRLMSFTSLFLIIVQSLLGGRMATTWSSHICLINGENCQLLDLHRFFAIFVTLFILVFVGTSLYASEWSRQQWPLLGLVVFFLGVQVFLGVTSIHFQLSEPVLTVSHQLVAALLVAFLSALSFRRPELSDSVLVRNSILEACHG